MIPYVLQQINSKAVADYYKDVLKKAWEFTARLPDRKEDQWTCHGLCRAFHQHWGQDQSWQVQDGHFGRYGSNHSWIWFAESMILDLYPIGGLTSFLVEARYTPWMAIYMQNDRVYSRAVRQAWSDEAEEALAAYTQVWGI